MEKINFIDLFLWTFRRNEKDVIKLYDSLSDLMRVATGGDMLNFGYWGDGIASPLEAQNKMCEIFGEYAHIQSNQNIVDIGSGLGAPATQWTRQYKPVTITCVNINFRQLNHSIANDSNSLNNNINCVNSTATSLPFERESVERVLALESAQHFKPLKNFISESFRILKKNGLLALAIPVMLEKHSIPMIQLGTLSMTWSSEHYSIDFVKSIIEKTGFQNMNLQKIGCKVYEPLANYYFENRDSIRKKISEKYPSFVERILFNSLGNMKQASEKKIIDYIFVTCKK